MADTWLDKLIKQVAQAASTFVAFGFVIFTAGMLYGLAVTQLEPLLLFIPPLLGLAAYYDPRIAGLILVGLFVLLFI